MVPALPVDENGNHGPLPGYVRAVIDARWFRSTIPNTQNKNRSLNKKVDFNTNEFQNAIRFLPNYMQWRYVMNPNFDPNSEQPEGLKEFNFLLARVMLVLRQLKIQAKQIPCRV